MKSRGVWELSTPRLRDLHIALGRAGQAPCTETQLQGQRQLAEVIPLQGGVPIKVGEETIGGVGLSGAPNGGPQEEACGKAGIAKVADQLK